MNSGDLVEISPMAMTYLMTLHGSHEPKYGILVSDQIWTMDSTSGVTEVVWNVLVEGKVYEIFETDLSKVKIEQFN